MQLMVMDCILKNSQCGEFYVMYILQLKKKLRAFPCSPVVMTCGFHCKGWFRSLVGELKSRKLHEWSDEKNTGGKFIWKSPCFLWNSLGYDTERGRRDRLCECAGPTLSTR